MKRMILSVTGALLIAVACMNEPPHEPVQPPVFNPSKVRFVQTPYTNVMTMTWKDNSTNETGFTIWKKVEEVPQLVATLNPNDTLYVFENGLEAGKTYTIGVRAEASDPSLQSQIVYGECSVFDYSSLPHGEFVEYNLTTTASVTLKYKLVKTDGVTVNSFGLCWSSEHEPTLEDTYAQGPRGTAMTKTQTISSCDLQYGKTYKVRSYVDSDKGVGYGPSVEIKLGEEPKGIILSWDKLSVGMPDGIELYKTTSKLNGRNFNAWYAIGDLFKVDFKVNLPSKRQTLENQYTSDNYVLINGGYFNMDTEGAISDYVCVKGTETLAKWCELYYGVFGVDSKGTPFTGWTSKAANQFTYFYDRPATVWYGVSDYGVCTDTYPHIPSSWIPYYAIAAGPLLVQNNNVIVDSYKDSTTGQYVTNYERRADDIFSPGTSNPPDRTAVGYTADGKVILFVCDGRITNSKGASIIELAQIMKGLGCVGALNLDGGGSTAMVVNGTRINYCESGGNRAVRTSLGFYKKN